GGVSMIIPAFLSKKANAPVMMRISREEETYIGRARPGFRGRMKIGFSKEGRITALDMFVVSDNGPYDAQGDVPTSGRIVSLLYQPQAMRWRGVTVLTNTPLRVRLEACRESQLSSRLLRKHRASLAWTRWPSGASTVQKGRRFLDRQYKASCSTRRVPFSRKRLTAAPSSSSGKREWGAHRNVLAARCAESACRLAAMWA